MWISDQWKEYEVLDASDGERLERWGNYILVRPDPQVIWSTPKLDPRWRRCDARYARSNTGGGHWSQHRLPEHWTLRYRDLTFLIKPMNFKHTGVFPEQAVNWDFMASRLSAWKKANGDAPRVLNLFAYTGGATCACAAAGAQVVHVDAAKGMVAWAKDNAAASGLSAAPIRYMVDDCLKFVRREQRRGNFYEGILMDPPSYGRGPGGEMWKSTGGSTKKVTAEMMENHVFSLRNTEAEKAYRISLEGSPTTASALKDLILIYEPVTE